MVILRDLNKAANRTFQVETILVLNPERFKTMVPVKDPNSNSKLILLVPGLILKGGAGSGS